MIFPKIYPPDKNSPAEKMVFAALEKLSEQDFDVFFSKSFRGIKDRQQDDYEIDFIIVDKRGSHINSIIIVEVKGGRLSYSGSENRWSQNGHLMDEGPDEQARKNKHFFLNKFHDAVTQIPVDWVVWFPEVQLTENCEMPTMLERWQLFDNISLIYPELQLQAASDSIIKNHANLSGISIAEYESTIKSGLLRGIGFVQPLNILLKQYDAIYHNLAKEQSDFFESIASIPRLAVSGGAGTGKTMFATSTAIDWGNMGKSVLLLCFNRLLQNDLQNTVKSKSVKIATFHSFAYDYINKFDPKWMQLVNSQDQNYYNITLPNKFFKILEKHPVTQKFDCLIIDEGQDFESQWIEAMLSFTRKDSNIIIFYDENQNIFNRNFKIPSKEKFLQFELKRNFRNTHKICQFVEKHTEIKVTPGVTPEGIDVDIINWESQSSLVSEMNLILMNLVKYERIPLSDIIIIVNGSSRIHFFNSIGAIGNFPLKMWNSNEERDSNTLYFTSIRKFKGLESNIVFLVLEEVADLTNNKEFYTQCTRAKSLLKVFWKG